MQNKIKLRGDPLTPSRREETSPFRGMRGVNFVSFFEDYFFVDRTFSFWRTQDIFTLV